MTVGTKSAQDVNSLVQEVVGRHGATAEALVPILSDINQELGYLTSDAMVALSRTLKMPKSQLFSVASFYEMLSTKPRGRHVIQFCESAPCHVVGGRQVWQTLQDELGLETGETSEDGKWTVSGQSSSLTMTSTAMSRPMASRRSWPGMRKRG